MNRSLFVPQELSENFLTYRANSELKLYRTLPHYSSLQHLERIANTANSEKELANIINASFLAPMSDFKPLPADYLSDLVANPPLVPALEVSTDAVFEKLSKLNPAKAHGPDDIPSWLLRENADLLSVPV